MGVKLNDEVATLICRAFLFISRIWEDGMSPSSRSPLPPLSDNFMRAVVLEPVLHYLPVAFIGWAGMLGASSLLALAADLVALLTLPFFACYVVGTLVYCWSLTTLGALFNVFRGALFVSRLDDTPLTLVVFRTEVQPVAQSRRAGHVRRRCTTPRHHSLRHAQLCLPDSGGVLPRVCFGALP